MSSLPLVSIIIPCRNEQKFIEKCLDSVFANDYPKERLEITVVDGMSEDGTREIMQKYTKHYQFVKVLDNPGKITPCALNIGIEKAMGSIVMRMDAHTTYERNYISKCINYMDRYKADNVGGIWKIQPRSNAFISKGIVSALSNPFGIGNAYYRFASQEPRWVDTVPFFCVKKEVFSKVGLFNENLIGSQDMEFSLRLRKAGYRTLLVPDIVSYYYARSDLKSFIKHNFHNGIWAIMPFKFTDHMPVSWRHLVPIAFVSGLVGSALLSVIYPLFLWLFLLISCSYFFVNLFFSVKIALLERNVAYVFIMLLIFGSLHLSYGAGSLWGLLRVSTSRQFWKNVKKILGQ